MDIFGGMFKNSFIGFDAGESNALSNAVYDASFQKNQYAMGSRVKFLDPITEIPQSIDTGFGMYAAYHSSSRGTSVRDVFSGGTSRGGSTWYFNDWDSDSSKYVDILSNANFFPYMYESSHLAGIVPPPDFPFSFVTGGGPFFLHSQLDRGGVNIGQNPSANGYAVKLGADSVIPDWSLSSNGPFGQLVESSP